MVDLDLDLDLDLAPTNQTQTPTPIKPAAKPSTVLPVSHKVQQPKQPTSATVVKPKVNVEIVTQEEINKKKNQEENRLISKQRVIPSKAALILACVGVAFALLAIGLGVLFLIK